MRPRQKLPPLHPEHPVGRSLTYSLLFHILVLLALTFVYISRPDPHNDIPVIEVNYLSVPAPEAPPSSSEALQMDASPTDVITTSEAAAFTVPSIVPLPEPEAVLATPAVAPDPAPVPRPTTGVGSRLGHRCQPERRRQLLDANGGTPECEDAVLHALRYFAAAQSSEGSWSSGFPVGLTSLATLAFLGHCELHDSPEFGETVTLALTFLIEKSLDPDALRDATTKLAYENALLTMALAEAHSLTASDTTRPPLLKEAAIAAARRITTSQLPSGGWYYNYHKLGTADTSITCWQIQALTAVRDGGIRLSGVRPSLDAAGAYLDRVQHADGRFFYQWNDDQNRHSPRQTLAAAGAFGLQVTAAGTPRDINRALDAATRGDPPTYLRPPVLHWYYTSLATFRQGGAHWQEWEPAIRPLLLDHQSDNGSWPIAVYPVDAVLGGVQLRTNADSTIYRTALCTLMLEVYYRYLKSS